MCFTVLGGLAGHREGVCCMVEKAKVIRAEAWIKKTLPVARWLGVGLPFDHIYSLAIVSADWSLP